MRVCVLVRHHTNFNPFDLNLMRPRFHFKFEQQLGSFAALREFAVGSRASRPGLSGVCHKGQSSHWNGGEMGRKAGSDCLSFSLFLIIFIICLISLIQTRP